MLHAHAAMPVRGRQVCCCQSCIVRLLLVGLLCERGQPLLLGGTSSSLILRGISRAAAACPCYYLLLITPEACSSWRHAMRLCARPGPQEQGGMAFVHDSAGCFLLPAALVSGRHVLRGEVLEGDC